MTNIKEIITLKQYDDMLQVFSKTKRAHCIARPRCMKFHDVQALGHIISVSPVKLIEEYNCAADTITKTQLDLLKLEQEEGPTC